MPDSDLLERARLMLPAMVDAVEALVCTESPSEDVEACATVVREAIGILEGWLPEPARMEEHGGRPVWRWGPEHPRVLLLGHLDTVWPLGSLARLPFSNDGERLRGPGVFDMKAGVVQGWAAMALCELSEADGVGMLLTSDEEIGSHASRDVIRDATQRCEAVLVLEPSLDGALKTARKGTSWYAVDLHGRAAHAGLDPDRGINALLAASHLAISTSGWADAGLGTTVTPTILRAGTTSNTVPAEAHLMIDVRAWTTEEQVRVDRAIRGWAPEGLPVGVSIGGGIDRPAMEETASADLFILAQGLARDLGLEPVHGRSVGGASDGNLTAAAGLPTLDGLGAVGDGAHADHEWASVSAMAERAALVARLVSALIGP
jgi:glutamate carboxypeptidase